MTLNEVDAQQLVDKWFLYARNKFSDASEEDTDFGKRFIEHGAMCYFNCARALEHLIKSGDLPPNDRHEPTVQKAGGKSTGV